LLGSNKIITRYSVDSIVTDPPYHLTSITKRFGKDGSAPAKFGTDGAFQRASKGFMGKEWDGGDISFRTEIWEECLRVLKPGGHLLSFGGSRTYHRMAVAIEDAGFSIRDQILWIYGSGFPKSYNIGKAVDKIRGNTSEVVGQQTLTDIRGGNYLAGLNEKGIERYEANITKGKSEWEGWGTAMKPAHEPLVLARKPFSGSVAQNVLAWGTGGINIDKSRIPTDDNLNGGAYAKNPTKQKENAPSFYTSVTNKDFIQPEGRFPANVIFDEEAGKILDEQSGISKSAVFDSEKYKSIAGLKVGNTYNKPKKSLDNIRGFTDEGGASRYFLNVENTDDEDFDTSTNHNPIVMARKPFSGSVANNVLEWRTGGINIEESRIDYKDENDKEKNTEGLKRFNENRNRLQELGYGFKGGETYIVNNEGRFPANVIFDEEAGRALDSQSGYSKSNTKQGNIENKGSGVFLKEDGTQATGHKHKVYPNTIQDEGGASRFFYCAKASKKDRNEGLENFQDKASQMNSGGIGRKTSVEKRLETNDENAPTMKNIHPTVKPTKLMEYLIKLITPPGGIVLDPFMGSGSTGKAAIKNNFNFIGIEKEKEYFDIAKARIEHAKGSGLFKPE